MIPANESVSKTYTFYYNDLVLNVNSYLMRILRLFKMYFLNSFT